MGVLARAAVLFGRWFLLFPCVVQTGHMGDQSATVLLNLIQLAALLIIDLFLKVHFILMFFDGGHDINN